MKENGFLMKKVLLSWIILLTAHIVIGILILTSIGYFAGLTMEQIGIGANILKGICVLSLLIATWRIAKRKVLWWMLGSVVFFLSIMYILSLVF